MNQVKTTSGNFTPPQFSEVILKTSRFAAMKNWVAKCEMGSDTIACRFRTPDTLRGCTPLTQRLNFFDESFTTQRPTLVRAVTNGF